MVLIFLLLLPLMTGLTCLLVRGQLWWERLNLLSSLAVAGLAVELALAVEKKGSVTALGAFLQADALSALVIGLTSFVSLVCAIYAVGYFRRDQRDGRITEQQLRHYYVLTPLFVCAMLLAPMADNLGVMW